MRLAKLSLRFHNIIAKPALSKTVFVMWESKLDRAKLSKTLNKLEEARKNLRLIVGGEKVNLDPKTKRDALFLDFMSKVDADAPSFFYRITPKDEADRTKLNLIRRTDTSTHLPSEGLYNTEEAITKLLSSKGVSNFEVAGTNFYHRGAKSTKIDTLLDRTDNLILAPSEYLDETYVADYVSALQAIDVIYQQLEAISKSDWKNPILQKSVTIINQDGVFNELIRYAGLDTPEIRSVLERGFVKSSKEDQVDLSPLRVSIVRGVDQVTQALGIVGVSVDRLLEPIKYPDIETLFFSTGNLEKVKDQKRIHDQIRYKAKAYNIDDAVPAFKDASEFKGTISSNCKDKDDSTRHAIAISKPGAINKRFKTLGEERSKAAFVTSDGCLIFNDPSIYGHEGFNKIRKRGVVTVEAGFPGPDQKDITNAFGGKEDFFAALSKAIRKTGPNVDKLVHDHASVILTPFDLEEGDDQVTFGVRTKTPLEFITKPNLEDANGISGRHYTKVAGSSKTIAELDQVNDDFMVNGVAMSRAYNILLQRMGHKPNTAKLDFNKKAHPDFRLMTDQIPIIDGASFVDPSIENPLIEKGIQTENFPRQIDDFDDLADFVEGGSMLAFLGRSFSGMEHDADKFLMKWVLPMAAVVSKQLKTRAGPLLIRETDHTRPFLRVLHSLYKNGVMNEAPKDIVRVAKTDDQAIDIIDAASKVPLPKNDDTPDYGDPDLPDSGKSNVTIYLSATSFKKEAIEDAYYLTQILMLNDLGVITGGMEGGPGGMSVYAALELIANGVIEDPYIGCVQEHAAKSKEGFPKGPVDAFLGDGHMIVTSNRFERMQKLSELDRLRGEYEKTGDAPKKLIISIEGGAGTLEENLILMWKKMAGEPCLQNTSFVFLNRGCYDQTFKELNGDLKDLGVYNCSNMHEVFRVINQNDLLDKHLEYEGLLKTIKPKIKLSSEAGMYPFEPEKNKRLPALLAKADKPDLYRKAVDQGEAPAVKGIG